MEPLYLKEMDGPEKNLKVVINNMDKSRESNDSQLAEDSRNQRIVDEVMDVRRQGSKATAQLKKDNPQKFKDYQSAIKQGYRAKGKSYKG